jgi:hypothetical protein
MQRATLCLIALLILGAPTLSRADEMNESARPNDYTQEDSHPLRFVSYFVTPAGFLLEWTVMRPIHWLATNPWVAPVMDSEYSEGAGPAPIAELPPPDYLPRTEEPPPLNEETIRPPVANPGAALETQPVAPPPPAETPAQPVLH